jgi:hypothetical protein
MKTRELQERINGILSNGNITPTQKLETIAQLCKVEPVVRPSRMPSKRSNSSSFMSMADKMVNGK